MTNQAKSNKNNDDFSNFIPDLLGSRGFEISDNDFLSLNSSKLVHVGSLLEGRFEACGADLRPGGLN